MNAREKLTSNRLLIEGKSMQKFSGDSHLDQANSVRCLYLQWTRGTGKKTTPFLLFFYWGGREGGVLKIMARPLATLLLLPPLSSTTVGLQPMRTGVGRRTSTRKGHPRHLMDTKCRHGPLLQLAWLSHSRMKRKKEAGKTTFKNI